MASTATSPTVTVSRLAALRFCSAVVAVITAQALPAAVAGMVPCTSSAAVSPGRSATAPPAPSGTTGSAASTTPLLLVSRTTRSAERPSAPAAQPAPLLTRPMV